MKLLVSEGIWDFDLGQALQLISAERREQALRFKHELGQRQCVLSYLLLKRLLGEVFDYHENPVFEYGEHGKPAVVGHPEFFFNISHCREAVGCAVSDRPVGFDVEAPREYSPSLLSYVMSEKEQAQITAAERPDIAFVRLWTQKEALLKLTGEGLSNDLKTVLETCPPDIRLDCVVSAGNQYVYTVATLLHEPLGCGGGTTNTH